MPVISQTAERSSPATAQPQDLQVLVVDQNGRLAVSNESRPQIDRRDAAAGQPQEQAQNWNLFPGSPFQETPLQQPPKLIRSVPDRSVGGDFTADCRDISPCETRQLCHYVPEEFQ